MKLLLILLVSVGAVLANNQYIEGEFFIGLEKGVSIDAFTQLMIHDYNLDVVKSYDYKNSKMMFVRGVETDVIRASSLTGVTFWDRNQIVYTQQCVEGSAATCWGLDRIDQVAGLPYTNPVDPSAVYTSGTDDGAGVIAYIVDTGILTTHEDFGGRATWGYTAPGLGGNDGNGHGTHCAGTTGGTTMGVAKEVSLRAVQVMNAAGSGSTDDIVDGLNYVTGNHSGSSVINLSLGSSGINTAMDNALQGCIDAGVTAAVASGNSDEDACNSSPGHMDAAVSVGASDVEDASATFSNYGPCLDLYAPGVNVRSTWNDANDAYNTISGTSMAAPHVCGAAARYLSSSPGASPAAVESYLVGAASAGVINFQPGHGTSPNLLLRVNCPM